MSTLKDGTALYEVERRARYAERPGFRITELQIGPTQEIPWHAHNQAQDTFYVLEGERRLRPGEIFAVPPGRPHRVTNGGDSSATFLVLQDGDYDFVPQS